MFFKKNLLTLCIASALAVSLSACGSSSSSSSSSNGGNTGGETSGVAFDQSAATVIKSGGVAESPKGVKAPTSDPEPSSADELVIQYFDETLTEADNINLWTWEKDCSSALPAPTGSWDQGGHPAVEFNEYGPVFRIKVTKPDADGCSGYIVRRGTGDDKLTAGDGLLSWTAADRSIGIAKGKLESALSGADAFNQTYSAASFEAKDAAAHFLSKEYIVYKTPDGVDHVRLQYDDVVLNANADSATNEGYKEISGKFVNLEKVDSLPEELKEFEWLVKEDDKKFSVYKMPADFDGDLKKMLKGEMLVIGMKGGEINSVSKVQTAELIDTLYDATGVTDLGATINADKVTFKLWAPTAKSVKIHLMPVDEEGKIAEDSVKDVDMIEDTETGVWSYTDEEGVVTENDYYKYVVNVYHPENQTIADRWVTDPYSLSLSTNSNNSQIVDLNNDELKPTGWDNLAAPHKQDTPHAIAGMVVHESHLRDLTVGPDKGISAENQGKFLGLTETESTVVKHLKSLADAGVTHLELLPIYDLATVQEDVSKNTDITLTVKNFCENANVEAIDAEKYPTISAKLSCSDDTTTVWEGLKAAVTSSYNNKVSAELSNFLKEMVKGTDSYNWGYDPFHYGVPEGSYATDAEGAARILETRQMIQSIKENIGMNVIMDVVYNHTDGHGTEKNSSVLDKIVPWYYNRLHAVNGNVLGNTCCSDSAAEHKMFAKLMEDTLVVWAKDYKVDAFRFDLMAYMPKSVMEETLANVRKRTGNNDIYFFGEGWGAGTDGGRFVQASQLELANTGIGTFTDRIRDAVRGGGPFDHGEGTLAKPGVAQGMCSDEYSTKRTGAGDDLACNQWYDMTLLGMAGNLKDYKFVGHDGVEIVGKDVSYWGSPAGYAGEPIETISYVSKHDNMTLFDLVMLIGLDKGSDAANGGMDYATKQVSQHALGLATALLGQAPAFDQQGTELVRTKMFENDSYNSGDFSNFVNYDMTEGNSFVKGAFVNEEKDKDDWDIINDQFQAQPVITAELKGKMVQMYKDLVSIRKNHPIIHLGTTALIQENVKVSGSADSVLVMDITKPSEGFDTETANAIKIVINPRSEAYSTTFAGVTGKEAVNNISGLACEIDGNTVKTPAWGVCVFTK